MERSNCASPTRWATSSARGRARTAPTAPASSCGRYQYDEEGNLVGKTLPNGQQWRYAWDGAGQLAEVRRPDGYAVTFTYDGLGRRVSKRWRGRVTHWVWDGDQPLHEWQELVVGPGAGSVSEVLTWLFEDESFAPLAKLTANGAQSVVCDYLGTPLPLLLLCDERGRLHGIEVV